MDISKFLEAFKERLLQKKLKSYLKKRKNQKNSFSLKKIKKVLAVAILVKNIQADVFQNQIQKEIASCLNLKKNDIKVVIYKERFTKNSENFTFEVHKNNFNWLGKVQNESLKNILQAPYDLFVSYNFQDNLYLNLCQRAAIQTCFFVGAASSPNPSYDLSIVLSKFDRFFFNQEMKKYLKILKKI